MLKREDIRIRDPFIFTDKENRCYYMYHSPNKAGLERAMFVEY